MKTIAIRSTEILRDSIMDEVRLQYMNTEKTLSDGIKAITDSQMTPIICFGFDFFKLIIIAWLMIGVYFLLFPPQNLGPGTASPALVMLGIGGACLGLPLLRKLQRRWNIRRRLSRLAEKDRWLSWTITPDDVEVRDHLATVRLKWATFTGAVEQRDGFLFLLTNRQGYFIPSAAFTFPEEARFVSDWARRRVAKYRKRQDIEVEAKALEPSFGDEL